MKLIVGDKSAKIMKLVSGKFSNLAFNLKDIRPTPAQDMWGEKPGCCGFISNGEKTCYISTEQIKACGHDVKYGVLIRSARDTKDYSGGKNEYVKTDAELLNWLGKYFSDNR